VARVEDATVLATDQRFLYNPSRAPRWEAMVRRVSVARTWGDCYGYVLVSTGRAELMVDDRLSPWDAAALIPIIHEAGGVYSDWTGAVTMDGDAGAIATNQALALPLREALGAGGDATRRTIESHAS
jgi:fructose-1,6-bisphosphatase/inositol monophosphatase family enzyme